MTRSSAMSCLCLSLLAAPASVAQAPESLAQVIGQHTAARGGADAIEAVRTIRLDITIREPGFTVDGSYRATRDGSMRIDVCASGQRVFTEALRGGQAWSRGQGAAAAAVDESPAGAAALRHGVEAPFKLFGLHEMPGRGHRLELRGRESVDGVSYHVIDVTFDDGYRSSYYLNPDTWLIDRERQRRALHVDVDPRPEWIETLFEDYRRIAGVLFPFRQTERRVSTGDLMAVTFVNAIEVNPALAVTDFDAAQVAESDEYACHAVAAPADTAIRASPPQYQHVAGHGEHDAGERYDLRPEALE